MNHPIHSAGLLAGLAAIVLTSSASAQDATDAAAPRAGARAQVEISRSGMPKTLVVSGSPTRATLRASEDDASVWTGALTLGGVDFPVQVSCPSAEKPATIAIGDTEIVSTPGNSQRGRTTWMFDQTVTLGGQPYTVTSLGQSQGRDGKTSTVLSAAGTPFYGTVELDGHERHLALLDGDGDGKISGSGDRWMLVTNDELAAFNASARGDTKTFNLYSMPRADHPIFLGPDRAVFLEKAGDDHAVLVSRQPEHDLSHYLHERAADINAGYGRDLSQYDEGRPKAETPIHWNYALDLDPLLAMAKEQGKPLLIDFETDWCGWCHVLDLVTYPDKEVAAFVNSHFIPVKWNCELDPHATHSKFEVRGFPSMVVVHPDGSKIDATVGFKKASEFVAELEKLHAAAQKAMGN